MTRDATERLGRAWGVVGHLNAVADTPELRAAYNEQRKAKGLEEVDPMEFLDLVADITSSLDLSVLLVQLDRTGQPGQPGRIVTDCDAQVARM